MAITATFSATTGVLSINGDNAVNEIIVSRNAAGLILVNGGAIAVTGGVPTIANTTLIELFGKNGADKLTIDEANGAMPRANVYGGNGDDAIIGGSGNDILVGGGGKDTILGKGGFDLLFGGDGNDTLTGGDADDQVFGEAGTDRMIWNPGDDTDLNEGGTESDTTEVNGGGGSEVFTLTANGTRARFDRLDPAPFAIDMGTSENLVLNMGAGDDRFSATGNLAVLVSVTVDGGTGNDTILGSNGADTLIGGDGEDFIDGQQGNDLALLGAGNDTFQWDPGDGNDKVEGQGGTDRLLFHGSAGSEVFEVSASSGRTLFTRNLANIVMDLNDVETLELNALGGTDTVVVKDLAKTDVDLVDIDLGGQIGGTSGDAAADVIVLNARNALDTITVSGAGTSLSVNGLAAAVQISNSEGANDTLVINGLGGNDTIRATTLPAGVIKLTLDGGAGNDTLLGSQGGDVLLGGDGSDFIFGDNGNDLALMGAGNDVFQWDPGDGNDTLEGQDGRDTMRFFGSSASESVSIFANGGRALFFRDVANVTMDLNDVETIDFRALGGADNIVVGDLSGTDVTRVSIDLRGPVGGGDGAADTVTVNGTQGDDVFGASGDAGGASVFGLQAAVEILFQEAANDRLVLNGLGGDDVIDATSLEAEVIQLTLNGGLGDDVLLGGDGSDFFNGGDGNDLALMGAGDDIFVWNPGDDNDTLEGQFGFDTMLFNGANASENINISPNGGRAYFFRDIASVGMDLNDVESIEFNALGGADNIFINEMSGTDVVEINLNLTEAANLASADTVTQMATNGDDVVLGVGDAAGTAVFGLAAQLNITGADAASDRLVVNLLGGDDTFEGSGLALGAIGLTVNGGDGNDVIVGGDGNDVLNGGAGDDVLIGGPGLDIIDGGTGDNIIIFLAGGGEAVVRGFDAGDKIDLSGLGMDVAGKGSAAGAGIDTLSPNLTKILADGVNAGGDAVLEVGGWNITLEGVDVASLQADDFLF